MSPRKRKATLKVREACETAVPKRKRKGEEDEPFAANTEGDVGGERQGTDAEVGGAKLQLQEVEGISEILDEEGKVS